MVEVHPAYLDETAIRIEFFGDEVERISSIHTVSGKVIEILENHTLYPAKQFVTAGDKMKTAIGKIREELDTRIPELERAASSSRRSACGCGQSMIWR